MNYIKHFKYTLLVLVAISIVGCGDLFKVDDNSYQGPAKVEFTPLARTVGLTPGQSGAVGVTAQLIGEQRNSDLTFDVSVVDSLTTAVEGDHYTLPSTSVTIPADSSSAVYAINVTGANLSEGETVNVAVELQGTDNVEPATNLKTFTLTLQGQAAN